MALTTRILPNTHEIVSEVMPFIYFIIKYNSKTSLFSFVNDVLYLNLIVYFRMKT